MNGSGFVEIVLNLVGGGTCVNNLYRMKKTLIALLVGVLILPQAAFAQTQPTAIQALIAQIQFLQAQIAQLKAAEAPKTAKELRAEKEAQRRADLKAERAKEKELRDKNKREHALETKESRLADVKREILVMELTGPDYSKIYTGGGVRASRGETYQKQYEKITKAFADKLADLKLEQFDLERELGL